MLKRQFGSVMLLKILRCLLTYEGQVVTNAEAWFNNSLRPRKPEGSLGRTAQDGHLDSHTAPELWASGLITSIFNAMRFDENLLPRQCEKESQ